jgi:hypothetical protein
LKITPTPGFPTYKSQNRFPQTARESFLPTCLKCWTAL